MNSVRATTQPMAREPLPSSSQASDREMACLTAESLAIRAVAAGTGSIHTALSEEIILAETSSAVSHSMVTSVAGSTPFWVSR